MARYKHSATIRDNTSGAVIASATVNIYLSGTETAATCYADSSTGTPLASSQTTTNSSGYLEFWIDPDDYTTHQQFKWVASKSGYADITRDELDILINPRMVARTSASVDLSGSAETLVGFHAPFDCKIMKATLLYTEASSADAGVTVEIGKESDRDYFYTGTTEISKSQWYEKDVTLLQTDLDQGDTLTLYSPGGKTGTGEIMLQVEYTAT